jgi:hypothetical protein
MKSIDAIIAWTPDRFPNENNPTRGKIIVLNFAEGAEPPMEFACTIGAYFTQWEEIGVSGRRTYIHQMYLEMIREDNLQGSVVRDALSIIDDIDSYSLGHVGYP